MDDLVFWASVSSIVAAVFTVLQYFKRHDRRRSDLPSYPIDYPQDRPLSPSPRAVDQQTD